MPNDVSGLNRGKQLILGKLSEGEPSGAVGESVRRLDSFLTSVEAFQHSWQINLWHESPHHVRTAHRFNDLQMNAICVARLRYLAKRLHWPGIGAENAEESKSGP